MKAGIFFISLIILFLLVSETTVTFKPFSISFPYYIKGLGACLLSIGLILWSSGERVGGYEEGLKRGYEITIETLKEVAKNPKNHE